MSKDSTGRITIRSYAHPDWLGVWSILEPVFRAGETYPEPVDISEEDAHASWITTPHVTYVATDITSQIVGTYYIKANRPGLGAHVCNCGYMVAEDARGRGIATQLCEHSQKEAVRLGYRAMQFNLVVSSNTVSYHLWKKLGYSTVGTLPNAFKHARLGYVDAYVMYKQFAG